MLGNVIGLGLFLLAVVRQACVEAAAAHEFSLLPYEQQVAIVAEDKARREARCKITYGVIVVIAAIIFWYESGRSARTAELAAQLGAHNVPVAAVTDECAQRGLFPLGAECHAIQPTVLWLHEANGAWTRSSTVYANGKVCERDRSKIMHNGLFVNDVLVIVHDDKVVMRVDDITCAPLSAALER